MPAAPTLVGINAVDQYLRISWNNSGTGDYNNLYRSTPTENGGLRILIATNLTWSPEDAQFQDFNVASGKLYVYSLVGVEGAVTAESTTNALALTLSQGSLHAVDKEGTIVEIVGVGGTYTNAMVESSAAVTVATLDLIPHGRQYGLAAAQYQVAGADIPRVGIGPIENIEVDFTIKIVDASDSNRALIRSMIQSRRYICWRDTRGNKLFGRLSYSEAYGATYTDLVVRFSALHFDESVV